MCVYVRLQRRTCWCAGGTHALHAAVSQHRSRSQHPGARATAAAPLSPALGSAHNGDPSPQAAAPTLPPGCVPRRCVFLCRRVLCRLRSRRPPAGNAQPQPPAQPPAQPATQPAAQPTAQPALCMRTCLPPPGSVLAPALACPGFGRPLPPFPSFPQPPLPLNPALNPLQHT